MGVDAVAALCDSYEISAPAALRHSMLSSAAEPPVSGAVGEFHTITEVNHC